MMIYGPKFLAFKYPHEPATRYTDVPAQNRLNNREAVRVSAAFAMASLFIVSKAYLGP